MRKRLPAPRTSRDREKDPQSRRASPRRLPLSSPHRSTRSRWRAGRSRTHKVRRVSLAGYLRATCFQLRRDLPHKRPSQSSRKRYSLRRSHLRSRSRHARGARQRRGSRMMGDGRRAARKRARAARGGSSICMRGALQVQRDGAWESIVHKTRIKRAALTARRPPLGRARRWPGRRP